MLQERQKLYAFIPNTWYIENENRDIIDLVHDIIILYLGATLLIILKSLKCLIQGRCILF